MGEQGKHYAAHTAQTVTYRLEDADRVLHGSAQWLGAASGHAEPPTGEPRRLPGRLPGSGESEDGKEGWKGPNRARKAQETRKPVRQRAVDDKHGRI